VDDDDHIRDTVIEVLQGDGYDGDGAADGAVALAKLETESPDAIVLDLRLPVMDGWEFVDRCRQLSDFSYVPIIVMSAARDLPATTERLHALGLHGCADPENTCRVPVRTASAFSAGQRVYG
jgi:CheY-like chemotaxis protein